MAPMNFGELRNQIIQNLSGPGAPGDPKMSKIWKDLHDNLTGFSESVKSAQESVDAARQKSRKKGKKQSVAAEDIVGDGGKVGEEWGRDFNERASKAIMKGGIATSISYALQRVVEDFNPLQMAFRGVIGQEIQFMRNMRAIGYETQGITGMTKSLQDQWQELGKSVAITGQPLTTMQNELVKGMKKGVTTQKDVVSVTKTGLHVATMIGDESNQIAGTFQDWHRTLSLDSLQMEQVGRDVQLIARETGVTGEHLATAVKQSEQFLRNMRVAGSLTSEGARNMMEMTTRFEKIGVGQVGNPLMEMMSSTTSFFDATNKAQQGFLAAMTSQSNQAGKLVMGTFGQAKDDFKQLAQSMDEFMRAQSGFSFDNIDQMPENLKAAMNVMFKNLGMGGVGAAKLIQQQFAEAGMSMSEKIAKINNELRTQNLTMDERTNMLKKIDDLQMAEGFKMLTQFTEVAKTGGDLNTAFAKLASGDGPKSIGQLQNAASMAANALKKAGGKDFTQAISSAIGSQDIKQIRTVMEDMSKEQQKVAIDEKKSLDPITKMGQWFNTLNETIRDSSRFIVTSLAGVIAGGAMIGAGAAKVFGAATAVEGMLPGGGRGLLGRLFGKGTPAGGAGGVANLPPNMGTPTGVGGPNPPNMGTPTGVGGPNPPRMDVDAMLTGQRGPTPPIVPSSPTTAAPAAGGSAIKNVLSSGTSALKGMGGQLVGFAQTLGVAAGVIAMVGGAIVLANKLLGPGLGLNVQEVTQTVEMMGIILGSAVMMAAAVTGFTYMTALLGAAFSGPWAAVLVPAMMAGAVALVVLTPALLALGTALIKMCSSALGGSVLISPQEGARVSENIKSITTVAAGIGEILSSASGLVYKFVKNSWWNFWSSIPMNDFNAGKDGLVAFVVGVRDMISGPGGMIEAINGFNVSESEMKSVAERLGAISYIMSSVGDIMGTMNEKVLMIKDKQFTSFMTDQNKMTQMTTGMTSYFKNILYFLRAGVFEPLINEFAFPRDTMREVAFRAVVVAAILDTTVKMLTTLNQAFGPVKNQAGKADEMVGVAAALANDKDKYAEMFASVSQFLSKDMIGQLGQLPEVNVLESQIKKVNLTAQIIGQFSEAMKSLGYLITKTGAGYVWGQGSSPMDKIAAADTDVMAKAVQAMVDQVTKASAIIDANKGALDHAQGNMTLLAGIMEQTAKAMGLNYAINNPGSPATGATTVNASTGATTVPSHADGGFITQSGLSMIHAGETVVPAESTPLTDRQGLASLAGLGSGDEAAVNFRATQAVADQSVHFAAIADHTSALPSMADSMDDMKDLLEWQKRYYMNQESRVRKSPPPVPGTSTRLALHQSDIPRSMWRLGTQVTGTEPPGGGYG